ncbi:MAG TPA: kelch repeat-containing protein [Flavisolibacter sp.]|jgi:hypothetical protein|nr:kelch repeat-containing protein [Flavisolibacter sp.]
MSKTLFVFLILATAGFISCKKDPSSTATNKAPVANAGKDITIRLPVDSAALDGSSSHDPDGRIESYLWRQIAGPSTADLYDTDRQQGKAKRLKQGIYSFELKVSDNSGSFSTDTVDVRILSSSGNIVANAGPDKVIMLPVMEASLDASASRDSSGLPLSYQWRQIEGPVSHIRNTLAVTTSVVLSTAGVYQFELKVSNMNGIAYDTTHVTVKEDPSCTVSRTEVPAQLIQLKQFTFSPYNTAKLLAVGNKLIIPVDVYDPLAGSYLFVYDVATGTYTVKELDFPRFGAATAVAGNKVFFAGGITDFNDYINPSVTDVVDIYDVASDTWSKAKLSQARAFVKAATVGNKVVFAGGLKSNVLSNRVDIYDVQTNQWTTSELIGEPRAIERVVTNQQSIYFLGGYTGWGDPGGPIGGGYALTTPTSTIDIYNVSSGGWSTANMEVVRTGFSAISVDDKIVIAGGVARMYPFEQLTANVEILTLPTMQRSNSCISSPTAWYGNDAAVIKNGSIVFYLGVSQEKHKFDIYNPRMGEWKVCIVDVNGESPYGVALATINNEVYVLIRNSLYKLDY